jgi:hypothetical protein
MRYNVYILTYTGIYGILDSRAMNAKILVLLAVKRLITLKIYQRLEETCYLCHQGRK